MGGIELAEEASVALAKQYPGYTFVAYEKGQQPKGIPLCEVSEWTENDPDNIYQSGMYKFKSKVVLEVRSGPKPLAGKR